MMNIETLGAVGGAVGGCELVVPEYEKDLCIPDEQDFKKEGLEMTSITEWGLNQLGIAKYLDSSV